MAIAVDGLSVGHTRARLITDGYSCDVGIAAPGRPTAHLVATMRRSAPVAATLDRTADLEGSV